MEPHVVTRVEELQQGAAGHHVALRLPGLGAGDQEQEQEQGRDAEQAYRVHRAPLCCHRFPSGRIRFETSQLLWTNHSVTSPAGRK